MDAVVMVLQPSEPRITISGADRLIRPESDFGAPDGMALFQDLHIVSTVTRADTAAADSASTSGAAHDPPKSSVFHLKTLCEIVPRRIFNLNKRQNGAFESQGQGLLKICL